MTALAVPAALALPALPAAAASGGGSLPKITFSSATYSRSEAGGAAVITIKRTAPSKSLTSTVAFSTFDNTATAGADYTDSDQTVTFTAKQTTATVNVPILQDGLFEGPETVNLILGAPVTNAQLGTQKTATLTIVDNELAGFSVNDAAAVTEGADAQFTVTLSNAMTVPVAVSWAAAAGTATSPGDFPSGQGGTLAFAPGELTKPFVVHTTDDTTDEPDGQTFSVSLSGNSAGTGIGDGSGAGSINDNDAAPTVVISDNPTATEGGDLVYTVSLSAVSEKNASGTWETWNSGTRWTHVVDQPWSIPAGSTSTTFTVSTTDDSVYQGSDETVWGHLTGATNATIPSFVCDLAYPDYSCNPAATDDAWGYGQLSDNDDPPAISIDDRSSFDAGSCADGSWTTSPFFGSPACKLVFNVTLDHASTQTTTVDFATTDGTALAGTSFGDEAQDYVAGSGTVTFLAGETSKTIEVDLLDSGLTCEGTETMTVDLSNAGNGSIADSSGLGTIYDIDC